MLGLIAMRRMLGLAAVGLAIAVTIPAAGSPTRGGALADDVFPSGGQAVVELTGLPPVTVDLSSAGLPDTVVRRGEQTGDTIPIEMVSLQLTGTATILNVPGSRVILQAGAQYTQGRPSSTGKVTGIKSDAGGTIWRADSFFDIYGNVTAIVPQQRGDLEFHYEFGPMRVEAEPYIWDLPPNRPVDRKIGRVDHFKCYSLKSKEAFKRRAVTLSDQFEDEKATVVRPVNLCTPVSKNRERVLRPTGHLKCYAITSTSDRPKQPEVEVTVTNQFGTAQLVVLEPRTLCLPTLKKKVKKAVPRPQPPAGSLTALTDHFKCYGVKSKSAFDQRVVALEDQFEVERARVLQPVTLCAPVEKNGVRLRDSTTHVVCYSIKDTSRKLKAGGRLVVVRNQFGVEVLTVLAPQMLCVPSTKKPPCSVYAERSRAPLRQGGQIVGYINEARHVPFLGDRAGSCP